MKIILKTYVITFTLINMKSEFGNSFDIISDTNEKDFIFFHLAVFKKKKKKEREKKKSLVEGVFLQMRNHFL